MKKFIVGCLILLLVGLLSIKVFVNHNKNMIQIPVLMYHDVILDEYYEEKADTITESTFEKHLQYFKDNNYKTLTLDELYDWLVNNKKIPKKSVVLTFDDGFYSFHYLVEPLLEKYNMHASCFVIGNVTPDTTSKYDPTKYGVIGKDLITKDSKYVTYGSHSYSLHQEKDGIKMIDTLSKQELTSDVKQMQNIAPFKYMSYPFNTDTKELRDVLKDAGYKLAFRGESEMVSQKVKLYQIPRIGVSNNIDEFKEIFESDNKLNRYGYGTIRKIMITIERKIGKRLFK